MKGSPKENSFDEPDDSNIHYLKPKDAHKLDSFKYLSSTL